MINIWNHKNRNPTVNQSFLLKNWPQIQKWRPSQHYPLEFDWLYLNSLSKTIQWPFGCFKIQGQP